jgi:hypothetical protein
MLEEPAPAGEQVALVLADEVVGDALGNALLAEVRRLFPHAERALLIPYRHVGDPDTADAILEAIARGRIDHRLVRPAPPRDEQFHQAVASFLAFGRPPVPPETSVPGVLAAGDVRHGSIKRVASAVGGSIAIRYVHQLLAS